MYIWKYVYIMHVNIAVELQQAWWNPRTSNLWPWSFLPGIIPRILQWWRSAKNDGVAQWMCQVGVPILRPISISQLFHLFGVKASGLYTLFMMGARPNPKGIPIPCSYGPIPVVYQYLSQYPISGMINSIRYILHLIWLDMSGFDFWNIMILTRSEYRNCHHHPWGCQQHLSVQWPFGYMALLQTEQNGKGQRIGIETVQRWEL